MTNKTETAAPLDLDKLARQHQAAPHAQAEPVAKVIISERCGTAVVMLAPRANLLVGDSLYAAPVPQEAEQASLLAADQTMTVQEVWLAAGGNPGIEASKQDVLDALKAMDDAVDYCDENHGKAAPTTTKG